MGECGLVEFILLGLFLQLKKQQHCFHWLVFLRERQMKTKQTVKKRCVLECETGQIYFDFDNDCKVGVLEGGKRN